jgi:hypothetical protein
LGQKQTFAAQEDMSALPPKADIRARELNVRFVPIADIAPSFEMQRGKFNECVANT